MTFSEILSALFFALFLIYVKPHTYKVALSRMDYLLWGLVLQAPSSIVRDNSCSIKDYAPELEAYK